MAGGIHHRRAVMIGIPGLAARGRAMAVTISSLITRLMAMALLK
jgi:hypothetical protein